MTKRDEIIPELQGILLRGNLDRERELPGHVALTHDNHWLEDLGLFPAHLGLDVAEEGEV